MTFLEFLAEKNIINPYQVDEILEAADGDPLRVESLIRELGLEEEKLLSARAEFIGMPFEVINDQDMDQKVLSYIPERTMLQYQIIPLRMNDLGELEVGIVDPQNIEARNTLQFLSSKNNIRTTLKLISEEGFERAKDAYTNITLEAEEALGAEQNQNISELQDVAESLADEDLPERIEDQEAAKRAGDEHKNRIVEDAPITKMVAVILRHAVEGRASDVHIEHTGERVKVRFRVDGVLHTSLMLPKKVHNAVVARIKVLARLKLDERRKPQDGRFHAKIAGRKIDFRVSTLPTFFGEKAVLRILDQEQGLKSLEDTGMLPRHADMVRRAIAAPFGLILITGPTGSGKTTTLYSMLQEIDREKRNVISLEDPIEYNISGLNQSQVKPEIGYTFATGLRSILRQDPDVIMVGEIRDEETAELAIQAALTGHLVFSTLHTNNSIGVIPRLIDMGVDPYLIAPTLRLAMAQRLTQRLCEGSATPKPIDQSFQQMIDSEFADLPAEYRDTIEIGSSMYEATPSPECPTGMRGRVAVYEMYEVNDEIENLILTKPGENEVYDVARKYGMTTMKEDAIIKSTKGIIPFSEINYL